jgi:spermidine synthase
MSESQDKSTGYVVRHQDYSQRFVFGATIFLSAFLLFQVQLILAKAILPWFGGTTAVWATCMVFYQFLLLGGYYWAHRLQARTVPLQGRIHLYLLAASAIAILVKPLIGFDWLLPGSAGKALAAWHPIPGILTLLFLAIGVPLLTLATTAPLLQKWYSSLHREESPYFLYSLSNAGSLLALLTYPIVFEPVLRLRTQGSFWLLVYAWFLLCCASCAWNAWQSRRKMTARDLIAPPSHASGAPVGRSRMMVWFLLSATGSILLLAITNLLTQDLAPIPLLWVLPLAVYLLSFILVFARRNLYWRGLYHPLFVALAVMGMISLFRGTSMEILPQVAIFTGLLFAACMVLHGELARLKPEAARLTSFYLVLSAGGAFGGLFVGILAPLVFPAIWEYHLGLWLAANLAAYTLLTDRSSWFYDPEHSPAPAAVLFTGLLGVPLYLAHAGLLTLGPRRLSYYTAGVVASSLIALWILFSGGPRMLRRREFYWNHLAVLVPLVLVSAFLAQHLWKESSHVIYRGRNFYGALSVIAESDLALDYAELRHGRITHGIQLRAQPDLPTTYYDPDSGVGMAIRGFPRYGKEPMRVGVIGLGTGTLAAYAKPGDTYRFYDINPLVIRLAMGEGSYFSFLSRCKGEVQVVEGDARLRLESELARGERQQFDVLVVDAFNGDSIPVHLLTREAFQGYLQHLRGPGSIIAVHVSNLAVDLDPVVAGLAEHFRLQAVKVTVEERSEVLLASDWILLSPGSGLQSGPLRFAGQRLLRFRDPRKSPPLWTDDYSDVWSLLNKE